MALLDSLGRISGETIFAETAIPHFPRAGMDGYAVRAVETRGATAESPSCLKVVGSLVAGDSMFYCNQTNNCAIKITTGAFIPTDFDAVVPQEWTDFGQDHVKIFALSLRAKTMRKLEKILLFSKNFSKTSTD